MRAVPGPQGRHWLHAGHCSGHWGKSRRQTKWSLVLEWVEETRCGKQVTSDINHKDGDKHDDIEARSPGGGGLQRRVKGRVGREEGVGRGELPGGADPGEEGAGEEGGDEEGCAVRGP